MACAARCVDVSSPNVVDDLRKVLQNVWRVIGLHQEVKELTVRIESDQLHQKKVSEPQVRAFSFVSLRDKLER